VAENQTVGYSTANVRNVLVEVAFKKKYFVPGTIVTYEHALAPETLFALSSRSAPPPLIQWGGAAADLFLAHVPFWHAPHRRD